MTQLADFFNAWQGIWHFLTVFAFGLAVALTIKSVLFRILRRLAEQTESSLDDEMLDGLRWPARLIVLFSALYWAFAELDARDIPPGAAVWLGRLMAVLIWVAITAALSRIGITCLVYWFRKQPDAREVTTLTRTAVTMVCSIPAILGLLNAFNVNLAPALTALGVGGIAVSLALKDTLANLFSGFYVSLAGNLRKGDYIRIDGGYDGWVEDIRWRITTLRTMGGNLVIIPNSKLSEAVVTNFSQPTKPMAVTIPLSVAYATDIDRFEQFVLEEVQQSIGDVEGLLDDPPPALRLNPGFGEIGLSFSLIVHVAQYEMQFAVTDFIRRRLIKRFRQEGITIPFQLKSVEIATGKTPGA